MDTLVQNRKCNNRYTSDAPTELLREITCRVLQVFQAVSVTTSFQRRKHCPNDHFYI